MGLYMVPFEMNQNVFEVGVLVTRDQYTFFSGTAPSHAVKNEISHSVFPSATSTIAQGVSVVPHLE